MTEPAGDTARRIITPAPFVPVDLPSPGSAPDTERVPWRPVSVMLLLAAGAGAMLELLPRWTPPAVPATVAAGAAQRQDEAAANTPLVADDTPATANARRSAQILLRAALARVSALRALKADSWERSGFHHLEEHIAHGEKAYAEQRFRAAQDAYRQALVSAAQIEAKLPSVVAALLERGDAALQAGHSAAADQAFAEVLGIVPRHAEATLGRARAANLDRVRALVEQAEAYEQMGEADKAREVYNEAARLDARTTSVQAGLARLEQGARVKRFEAALSDGHRALARNDYNAARAAFQRAAAQDAHAPEARAGLRDTERRATADAIATALARAGRAEREEAWQDAARAYAAALALDPELDDAARGRQAAAGRAELDARLVAMAGDVAALIDGAQRDTGEALLKRAQGIAQPGPRLRAQTAALAKALRDARAPLTVTLISDGESEISVAGVGALGRFQEHALALTPGRHTALVRHDGGSELRIEFMVAPGAGAPRVVLKSTP